MGCQLNKDRKLLYYDFRAVGAVIVGFGLIYLGAAVVHGFLGFLTAVFGFLFAYFGFFSHGFAPWMWKLGRNINNRNKALLSWIPVIVGVLLIRHGESMLGSILWTSGVLLQFYMGCAFLYRRLVKI